MITPLGSTQLWARQHHHRASLSVSSTVAAAISATNSSCSSFTHHTTSAAATFDNPAPSASLDPAIATTHLAADTPSIDSNSSNSNSSNSNSNSNSSSSSSASSNHQESFRGRWASDEERLALREQLSAQTLARVQGMPVTSIPRKLQLFITTFHGVSRTVALDLLHQGRIHVDFHMPLVTDTQAPLLNGGVYIVPDMDRVWLDGTIEINAARHKRNTSNKDAFVHYVLHKPKPMLCAHNSKSTKHERSLKPILAQLERGVTHVGRLDNETTGLLLLTNDGMLNHLLRFRGNKVMKRYQLVINEPNLSSEDPRLQQLRDGVQLHFGMAHVEYCKIVQPNNTTGIHANTTFAADSQSMLELGICEGRNRIVRRLCKAVRLPLDHLHRSAFGCISLDDYDLAPGQVKVLSQDDIEALQDQTGSGTVEEKVMRIQAVAERVQRFRSSGIEDERICAWFTQHNLAVEEFALAKYRSDITEEFHYVK
jgi:23S rRNA pseudouridine2605 synthase